VRALRVRPAALVLVAALAALAGPSDAAAGAKPASTVCAPTTCPNPTARTVRFPSPAEYRSYVLVGTRGAIAPHAWSLRGAPARSLRVKSSPVIGVAPAFNGAGYYVAERDGAVVGVGSAKSSSRIAHLKSPIVGVAANPRGPGVWLVDRRGDVFARGGAKWHGSVDGTGRRVTDVVGIAAAGDGRGYYVAERNGSVVTLGEAQVGSPQRRKVSTPVTGITTDPLARGYWLLSRDGTVTPVGNAPSFVSHGSGPRGHSPAVGIAAVRNGHGYFVLRADGRVVGYGNAASFVPPRGTSGGFVGVAVNPVAKLARLDVTTQLTVAVGDLAPHIKGRVTVTGPDGFQRRLSATRIFTGVPSGIYRIIADGIPHKGSLLQAQWHTTTAVVASGAQARVAVPYDIELNPRARSLLPRAVLSVVEVTPGNYKVRASDPTGGLSTGDVLAVAIGPKTPEGLLLKVGGLTRNGGVDSFDATRGELTDLAPTGAFTVQNMKLSMPAGEQTSVRGHVRSHSIFSNSQLSFSQGVTCTGQQSVLPVSGGVTFQPSLNFSASWGGFWHPLTVSAAFAVGATEGFNYTATFSGSENCQYSHDLLKDDIKLGTITVPLADVPVVITPKLNFAFQATGSVTGSMTLSASEQASQHAGLQYVNGHLSPIHDFSSNFSLRPISDSASATFQVGINPQLTFGQYDTDTGPFIGAYGYLQYDVGTGNPWWDLKFGLQPNAGLQFKLFGHTWSWTYSWPGRTWTVAQATTPLPPSVTTTALPRATVGSPYNLTLAAHSGAPPVVWKLSDGSLPPGIGLSPSSGVISGTPTSAGTYMFTVTPIDHDGQAGAAHSFSITVAPAPLVITTSTLPGGTVGSAYHGQLNATGGTKPYTWSITSGALPAGLTLDSSSGAITGTPTAAGSPQVTFQARDAAGQATSVQATISIVKPALSVSTASLPTGELEQTYDATLTASGGIQPYTWAVTSGSLPQGLSLNTSTGEISGTPVVNGNFPFTVQATDSLDTAAVANLSITVTTPSSLLPNGVGTFEGATEPTGAWDTSFSQSNGAVTNDACLTAGTSGNQSGGSSIAPCNLSTSDATGSGALQLTTNSNGQVGAVFYNNAIPTSAGLDVTFDTYQYDTDPADDDYNGQCDPNNLTYPACSGADGVAFSLSAVGPNPSNPSQTELPQVIGGPGATLGYAAGGSLSGLDNGYLGIGFDAFGNFANNSSLPAGCATPTGLQSNQAYAESVTVHGPGNGGTGYCIIHSTAQDVNSGAGYPGAGGWDANTAHVNNPGGGGPLDAAPTAPGAGAAESTVRPGTRVPVEVIVNPASNNETVQSTDDGGAFTVPTGDWAVIYQPIGGTWQEMVGTLPTVPTGLYPSGWVNPQSGLPHQTTFGWTASDGSVTELHEVNNVQVHPTTAG
jgi:hypothetical protein